MSIDIDYARANGEEIRARLFLRPTRVRDEAQGIEVDGPIPVPRPTAFSYQAEGDQFDLIFVPLRSVQQLGADPGAGVPPDAVVPAGCFGDDGLPTSSGWVLVLVDTGYYVVDLTLGHDPLGDDVTLGEHPELLALLRAVAGVRG